MHSSTVGIYRLSEAVIPQYLSSKQELKPTLASILMLLADQCPTRWVTAAQGDTTQGISLHSNILEQHDNNSTTLLAGDPL